MKTAFTNLLQRYKDADYGSLIHIINVRDDTHPTLKLIKAVIKDKPESELYNYLSVIAGHQLLLRDSEFHYKGEYNYLVLEEQWLSILLIPAVQLDSLPRRLRRKNWKFLKITCLPTDNRFDSFPDYVLVPAGNAKV